MRASFICLTLIIIFQSNLVAQNRTLPVPFNAQRTDSWCWAACMQSILSYHNTSITQCKLSEINLQEKHRFAQITDEQLNRALGCCGEMCIQADRCRFESSCTNCNVTISSINSQGNVPYFQNIFSKLSFKSKEDTVDLTWDQVKNQIDSNRPFILALDMQLSTNSEVIGHALIAKGYESRSTPNGNNFIKCYNPWKYIVIQSGREICRQYRRNLRINHLIFQRANGLYHNVDSYVIDIHKPTISSLRTLIESRGIVQDSIKEIDSMFGLTQNLNDKELDELLKDKTYQKINVKYITKSHLGNNSLDFSEPKRNIIEIVNRKTKPETITSFQKINNEWIPVEIYEKEVSDLAAINVNGKSICLNGFNCQEKSETVNFELIKFYPYPYEFYRFTIDKKSYLSPVDTYGDFKLKSGNYISKNEAYRESKILDSFKNKNLIKANRINNPIKDNPTKNKNR